MPSKDSLLLNVCIIPDPIVGEQCVALSQSLKSDGTVFVLDGETKFPHMTLYMARFPQTAIASVVQGVKEVLASATPIPCTHSGYCMTTGNYFEVSFEKTEELLTLQSRLIEKVKEYRSNKGKEVEEKYYSSNAEEKRRNVRETGYDLAGELYRPHISLTKYKEGMVPSTKPEFPATDLSFTLSTVGIYIADENGAVVNLLESLALS